MSSTFLPLQKAYTGKLVLAMKSAPLTYLLWLFNSQQCGQGKQKTCSSRILFLLSITWHSSNLEFNQYWKNQVKHHFPLDSQEWFNLRAGKFITVINKYRNFIGKEAQKGPINEIRWQRRFWDFTSHLLFVCGCLCIAHECECQKTTCRSLFSFFTRLVPRKWTQGHQAWQQTPLPTEPSSSSAQLWGFTRQIELEPKPINNGDPLRLHFQMSYCEKCLWMKKRWWWKMQRRTKAKKIWKSNGSQTTKTKLALVRLEKKNTNSTDTHIREEVQKM